MRPGTRQRWGGGRVGADGPRKGQWPLGSSGPGLTSPLTWGTPLPSLSLSVLTGVEESPLAIHCVARMVGSVALTLQRVQGVILNMNTGLILAQITRGWTPVLLFITHMLSNVQIPSCLPHLNLCTPTHLHIGTPHSSIQTHLQTPPYTFISPHACIPSSTHTSTPHP